MTYPGNQSLAEDIQQRIHGTFEHSLEMARKGNRPEALLGCEFVLKLDPMFRPAALLKEGLESGDTVDFTAVENALKGLANPQPDLSSAGSELDFGLDELDLSDNVGESAGADLLAFPEDTPLAPQDSLGALEQQGIDLTGGSLGVDAEGQARIDGLLNEGQAAFERGAHQEAIDSWSRIFLIDIENTEATRRIELARRLRAEGERKVEEAYHEAVRKMDAGQADEAKEAFRNVLKLDPDHFAAREQLEALEGDGSAAPSAAVSSPADAGATRPSGNPGPIPGLDADANALSLDEDLLSLDEGMPPPPPTGSEEASDAPAGDTDGAAKRPPSNRPAPSKPSGRRAPNRKFLMIGSAVLAVVVLVGGFVLSQWDSLFTNSKDGREIPADARVHPIEKAQSLVDDDELDKAVALLGRIPSDDPRHDEAQSLIAQWTAPDEPEVDESADAVVSEERLAYRQGLIEQASSAISQRRYLMADRWLSEAGAIAPLEEAEMALRSSVDSGLSPVSTQLSKFRSGDWEYALPDLWRMRESEPGNPDITQLIVDCYHNLGVRDLQRGDTGGASRSLAEAAELHPGDEEIKRLIDFTSTYQSRSQDLLYRIYVKYLPFR